jgi:tetratricopeptide (TPR) repeat protein
MRPGSTHPASARPTREGAPYQSARPSLPDISTLDEAGRFQRVELLCQRSAYDEALPIMRGLLERDRKNAKYLGMLSHVLYGRSADANFSKELIDTVNQTLRIDPDEVQALYTKARCYKRLGKEREALHYFRRTMSVDRNHLDAAREARLLMSRLRRSQT